MAPTIEELGREYEKDQAVKIGKLNVDENQEIAGKYNIMGVPTILIYKKGQVVEQAVGLRSRDDLKALIEKNNK
jgi:thioredoxin 1